MEDLPLLYFVVLLTMMIITYYVILVWTSAVQVHDPQKKGTPFSSFEVLRRLMNRKKTKLFHWVKRNVPTFWAAVMSTGGQKSLSIFFHPKSQFPSLRGRAGGAKQLSFDGGPLIFGGETIQIQGTLEFIDPFEEATSKTWYPPQVFNEVVANYEKYSGVSMTPKKRRLIQENLHGFASSFGSGWVGGEGTEDRWVACGEFMLFYFFLDDIWDKTGTLSQFSRKEQISLLTQVIQVIEDIYLGKFLAPQTTHPHPHDILDKFLRDECEACAKFPRLTFIFKLFLDLSILLTKIDPHLLDQKRGTHFIRECRIFMEYSISYHDQPLDVEKLYEYMRSRTIGAVIIFEYVMLMDNFQLSDVWRDDRFFKHLVHQMSYAGRFINDLLSLKKEVMNGEDQNIVVMRVKKGYSLQQAYDQTLYETKVAILDFENSANQIIKYFDHHPDLQRAIFYLRYCLKFNIHFHFHNPNRYLGYTFREMDL